MDEETIRLYLHSRLAAAFPGLGLYHSPSGDELLSRPCVVYEPKEYQPSYANNEAYVIGTQYQVTIFSDLPGYMDGRNIFNMPGVAVEYNSRYVVSDIVHQVFTVAVNSI